MADRATLADQRRARAVTEVEHWLLLNAGGVRRLTTTETRAYPARKLTAAWRLQVDLPTGEREIDLLLCSRFPWRSARVALVDRSSHLILPHVEADGVLCALPDHTEVDANNPVGAVRHVLLAAVGLIDDGAGGARDDDFRAEFRSYWPEDERAPEVRSIINPAGPTRRAKVWRGDAFYLVGDDGEAVLRWLDHYATRTKAAKRSTEDGVLLWLDQPLLPSEYPRTAADVLTLARARTAGGEDLIRGLVETTPQRLLVLLGAQSRNGPALAAITMGRPPPANRGPGRRSSDPLQRGFRPGKMPASLTQAQMLGASRVLRSRVERVDAPWVHGRGTDPRQPSLATTTVAMVGCGSVGAPVAKLLAQAGVGRLVLIDPELLTWANVGRHVLGAQGVRKSKATELAVSLKSDYPHMAEVVAKVARWEDIAEAEPAVLESSDLIVSTVGSWGAEGALNEWHLDQGRTPPIIFGWTEAHACAGQAVAIAGEGGCLACGLSNFGVPQLRVTEWPAGVSRHQEPACGAVYQPYGPTELAHVVAAIADLAIDTVLGRVRASTHRIWCGRRALMEAAGGSWTPEWEVIAAGRTLGGFLEERVWLAAPSCAQCQREAV